MSVTTVDFSVKNGLDQRVMNIYDRLKTMIKENYKADLKYVPFNNPDNREQKAVMGLLRNNDPLMFSSRTLFPVYVEEEMTGYAEINLSRPTIETQIRIRQLIDLLLVRSVKNSVRIRNIKRVSKNYSSKDPESKNVVFLDTTNTFKHRIEKLRLPMFEKSFNPKDLDLNFPILLQGYSVDDIYKMAHEIHYHSNRYAFINFDQIKNNTKLTVSSLHDLGPVTLFISNLENLSAYQQLILRKLVQRPPSLSTPQIVAGIQRGLDTVEAAESVDDELLGELARAQVLMKFSFDEYKNVGVKKFLKESLSHIVE